VRRRHERRFRPVVEDARRRRIGAHAVPGRISVLPGGHDSPGWICVPRAPPGPIGRLRPLSGGGRRASDGMART
jgi:hypothetical protein